MAVVAQALLGMASSLAATRATATIAAAAAIAILVSPVPMVAMLCAIASAGLLGLFLDVDDARPGPSKPPPVSRTVGAICLIGFMGLLVGLPFAAQLTPAADLFDRIYRAGSLVFGGGHVVLPLLEGEMDGLVDKSTFVAGYGAAQAMPGPLFTFAAYLGAVAQPFGGIAGAVVALVAVFLPGALLVLGVMPFWERLRRAATARRILKGVNAAVVGILAAALYDPVFTSGVPNAVALALAIAAFVVLRQWNGPPWGVVLGCGLLGALLL
ncbi:MAG: chromate transporter [Pseudomonadota bacterium]